MKFSLLIFQFLITTCCISQTTLILPSSTPENEGLSSDSLTRVTALMQKYVDDRKLPGMITMVARHGKIVYNKNIGWMGPDKPMQSDAIFRIASMTKPLTSVAVMILYDEGLFQLDDPVSKYIPEFSGLKVYAGRDEQGIRLADPVKPMTIRNLLTHTSGLASGGEDNPVDSMYRAAGLSDGTLKDMILKLAGIPLLYQPGTQWNYSRSTDVLAYLVEVVSGKRFDAFLNERILDPLKMEDTGYTITAGKTDRVMDVYAPGNSGGITPIAVPDSDLTAQVKFLSGNGGLISTADDYMIFCQMLLNKGNYQGVRILNEKTVELMTSDQIIHEKMPDSEFFGSLLAGMGFGLGFAVVNETAGGGFAGTPGSYWWAGTANTYFFIDPSEDLVLIFMTQFVPNFYYPVCRKFRELVYRSIVKTN